MGKPSKKKQKVSKALRKGALPQSAAAVWEAGLGALGLSLAGTSRRFDALVAEGRRVEAGGSRAVHEALRRLEVAAMHAAGVTADTAADTLSRAEASLDTVVETALAVAGVPSRSEVAALHARVRRLEARVAAAAAVSPVQVTVEPGEGGWTVGVDGQQASVHPTKKAALAAGRGEARACAPSRLVAHRADGSVGETTDYGG